MNMLDQLHKWLERKTCQELDDCQLERKIRIAYRNVEPPTPSEDLFAQIRARAAKTPQLPSADPTVQTVQQGRSAFRSQSHSARQEKHREEQRVLETLLGEKRYNNWQREHYRNFIDVALNQMRANFVDSALRLL